MQPPGGGLVGVLRQGLVQKLPHHLHHPAGGCQRPQEGLLHLGHPHIEDAEVLICGGSREAKGDFPSHPAADEWEDLEFRGREGPTCHLLRRRVDTVEPSRWPRGAGAERGPSIPALLTETEDRFPAPRSFPSSRHMSAVSHPTAFFVVLEFFVLRFPSKRSRTHTTDTVASLRQGTPATLAECLLHLCARRAMNYRER